MTQGRPELADPGAIGDLSIPNRLFVAGHSTNLGVSNRPTARHVAYWGARARGGAGLVITDPIRVLPNTTVRPFTIGGYDDAVVEGLAAIVDAVHDGGARAFAQLLHVGREAAHHRSVVAAWTPSAVEWSTGAAIAHVYDDGDLAQLVKAFRGAADRAVQAGYDGIEVHAGHGHGLHQFLSPISNQRTDAYGGSAPARVRIVAEVLSAVHDVARGRPVGLRISADEFLEGGLTPELMVETVGALLAEVPIAFLHVSHSAVVSAYSLSTQIADMSFGTAPFRHFPAHFKRAFADLPVLAICRMDDREVAAEILAAGDADFIGYARGAIADPNISRKWLGNEPERVRSCIACNECIGRVGDGLSIGCVANPEAGRESAWHRLRTSPRAPRSVAVIGGGPAGLSAAAGAARVGHRVTLYEASGQLGGLATVAAGMRNRSRIQRLIDDLIAECDEQRVEVRLEARMQERPAGVDQVIVAIGAHAAPRPDWARDLHYLAPDEAALLDAGSTTDVVLVDEDGGWEGAGVAEHLASAGYQVHIVSRLGNVGWRIVASARAGLITRLAELKVDADVACRVVGATSDELILRSDASTVDRRIPIGSIVVHCRPRVAEDWRVQIHDATAVVVGDAKAPRGLLQATYEGRLAGASIGVATGEVPAVLTNEL